MQPVSHPTPSHFRLPSLLHRSQTSRAPSGSGSGIGNTATDTATDALNEVQAEEVRAAGAGGRESAGDDVLRDYEEKRDRLYTSLESSLTLLSDLRTFNASSWTVRYPSFQKKTTANPSSGFTPPSSLSSSSSKSIPVPGTEAAGGNKKPDPLHCTLTMTFADDPTTSQEVELTTADPVASSAASVPQSHGRSQSAVTQAVYAGAGGTACGPDVRVKRKALRRSLTAAVGANGRLENRGVLGIGNGNEEADEMTDFSILRLDLSFGHGQQVTTQVGGIITSLEKNSISRLLSSRLENALSHIRSLQSRIMSTRSRVLVTGDLNAGKSTFVNALLRRGGRDEDGWPGGVMPVDQQPLTGRFVEVFGGEEIGNQDEVEEVHVIKGREEDYDPKDEGTFRRIKVEELIELVAEQEADQPPLKVYLKEPRKDVANPSILHNGILDISLIDAPGLNRDVIPTTSTFTRSPTIDVIIFVVSAANHFTLSAKEFILSAGQEKARMFIVVNRFDEVRDKEKCKRVVLEQVRQLSPKTWEEREELVHFVDSAKVALRCGEMVDAQAGGAEVEQVDEAFKSLENSLRSFVLVNRAKSKLGPAENYLCHLLADVDLLASANAVVAEDERDRAREEKERVKPGLEVMVRGSHGLEENLGEEEEKIGGVVDNRVKQGLGATLQLIGRGKVNDNPDSLPPYPGLLGVWDYAIEVRKAMLRSIELAVGALEDDTRKITADTVKKVGELGEQYLPKDVVRSNRVFNPQAMFTAGTLPASQQPGKLARRKSTSVATVGLGLASRSELSAVSLADIFDIHHYVLSAKATLTGSSKAEDGHDGELTVLGMASLAAGAVTMFGGKALGVRHAIESVVSLGEILENKAARRWAGPVVGAVVLGLAAYIVQDLPASIPRNIGRQIQAALESSNASMFLGDGYDGTYTNAQSARMQKEARKVIRLASWDLRERFRAALEEKHKIVRESEEQEKKAAEALEYFSEVQKRVLGIKGEMGKSVFA